MPDATEGIAASAPPSARWVFDRRLADNIRSAMKSAGVGSAQLARALSWSDEHRIYAYLTCDKKMDAWTLARIASSLGCDVGSLLPEVGAGTGDAWAQPRRKGLRPVACFETGERFESVRDASSAAGVSPSAIGRAVREGCNVRGRHYYYADGAVPDVAFFRYSRRGRAVVCVETGERFESVSAAARSVGGAASHIVSAIARSGRSHGFHWEYADAREEDDG